jgi:hypothetical protein
MIKNTQWLINLETILFIWFTWRIGYGSAIATTWFWLIIGTLINIMSWYMLFRDLYVPWINQRYAFMVCFILFCWYCWRIPTDGGPTLLLTVIYEFIDIGTWMVAGLNLVLLIKGIFSQNDMSHTLNI